MTGWTQDASLAVRDLRTYFPMFSGSVKAVNGVSFDIDKGEIVERFGKASRSAGRQIVRVPIRTSFPTACRTGGECDCSAG